MYDFITEFLSKVSQDFVFSILPVNQNILRQWNSNPKQKNPEKP